MLWKKNLPSLIYSTESKRTLTNNRIKTTTDEFNYLCSVTSKRPRHLYHVRSWICSSNESLKLTYRTLNKVTHVTTQQQRKRLKCVYEQAGSRCGQRPRLLGGVQQKTVNAQINDDSAGVSSMRCVYALGRTFINIFAWPIWADRDLLFSVCWTYEWSRLAVWSDWSPPGYFVNGHSLTICDIV